MDTLSRLARQLELGGWVLRSGGADGADSAFEAGIESRAKEIYLPWANFNGKSGILANKAQWDEAERLASAVHPAWSFLKPAVRKLHARNTFQILGLDLATPSAFVLCWTPDGAENETQRTAKTGGTGTAIVLAHRHGIPVINFANPGALERFAQVVAQSAPSTVHTPARSSPFSHLQRPRQR